VGQVTLSIGVAQIQENETLPGLIDRADKALYRAKKEGRNRVCCAVESNDM
jgi:diguanylate cyclase (GGDEF)-like protein